RSANRRRPRPRRDGGCRPAPASGSHARGTDPPGTRDLPGWPPALRGVSSSGPVPHGPLDIEATRHVARTEAQSGEGRRVIGADEGNRTPVSSLGSSRSAIELHPRATDFISGPRAGLSIGPGRRAPAYPVVVFAG